MLQETTSWLLAPLHIGVSSIKSCYLSQGSLITKRQLWTRVSEITGSNPMSYFYLSPLRYRIVFCKGSFESFYKAQTKLKPTYPKLRIPILTLKMYAECNSIWKVTYSYINGVALCERSDGVGRGEGREGDPGSSCGTQVSTTPVRPASQPCF